MKSKRIVKASVIALVFCLGMIFMTACGGNDIKGVWYYVPDASEISYENIEFKDDGVMTCEGIEGKYAKNDDGTIDISIGLSFAPVEFTCTPQEYEGYDVLYSDYHDAYYARSIEDAKAINELLEEESSQE